MAQLHISKPEESGLSPNGMNNIPDMELDFICKCLRIVKVEAISAIVKDYLSQQGAVWKYSPVKKIQ